MIHGHEICGEYHDAENFQHLCWAVIQGQERTATEGFLLFWGVGMGMGLLHVSDKQLGVFGLGSPEYRQDAV